jgi:hypothetical protein
MTCVPKVPVAERTAMDYWELATDEIKKVMSAFDNRRDLNDSDIAFIEHAKLLGKGNPIPNYPLWSEALGSLRDEMLLSGGNPLVGKITNLLTVLIWQWEYGAMEEQGYRSALELAKLARTLPKYGSCSPMVQQPCIPRCGELSKSRRDLSRPDCRRNNRLAFRVRWKKLPEVLSEPTRGNRNYDYPAPRRLIPFLTSTAKACDDSPRSLPYWL